MNGDLQRLLADEAATEAAGRALAAALPPPPFAIALAGPLGAGKSSLARALLGALGVTGPVPSPTYTLIEPYDTGRGAAYHVDLYRLEGPDAVQALALEELTADAYVFVEWPERGAGALPPFDLEIALDYAERGRTLAAHGLTAAGREALRRWSAEG